MPNINKTPRARAKAGKKGKDLLRASIIEKNKKTVVPRATPVAMPAQSNDARFRPFTRELGGAMQKVDKDGNPIGKPYYAPPSPPSRRKR
tara:strand:+ start:2236 stop:2505 length:270 start_codon:yes stop_codon:yes gene_type:complete